MAITREDLKVLREKVNEALAGLEADTGFKLSMGNINYSENTFTGKIDGIKIAPGETQEDVERKIFMDNIHRHALEESDFGRMFKHNNKVYKVAGFNPKARTKTILVEELISKKIYVMTPEHVKFFTSQTI